MFGRAVNMPHQKRTIRTKKMGSKLFLLFLNKLFGSVFHPFYIAIILVYHNNTCKNNKKLKVHTNYKLHEVKKAKTTLRRTQNLLKVTCRLKYVLYIYLNLKKLKYIRKVYRRNIFLRKVKKWVPLKRSDIFRNLTERNL